MHAFDIRIDFLTFVSQLPLWLLRLMVMEVHIMQ